MRGSLSKSISLVVFLAWAAAPAAAADKPACAPGPLKLASFNIQFLGSSARRHNEGLAGLVGDQDIVLVQELVAPPFAGSFPPNPDGTVEPFKPDPQAAAFFEAMRSRGFSWVMSEEDTGTGDRIHLNSTATEWWVAFYKPQAAAPATDLPGGFLASDRSNHPDYERVPFAFPFRNCSGTLDLVSAWWNCRFGHALQGIVIIHGRSLRHYRHRHNEARRDCRRQKFVSHAANS